MMVTKLLDFSIKNLEQTPVSENVAVFIPTINESTLEAVVRGVKEQLPYAEIMVLGFGESINVARKYNTLFLDLGQKSKKSDAINLAMLQTKLDWIIVIDADAIPEPGWGNAMLNEFRKGIKLFSGSVNISQGNYWMRVYNLSLLHEFTKEKPAAFRKHIPAICMGFTREAYNLIGPLQSLDRSEDYEWSLRSFRKGLPPFFSPVPSVLHLPVNKKTFRDVWYYWLISGPDNIIVRILYREELGTPFLLQSPFLLLIFSPLLAIVPTLRILKTSPKLFFSNIELIPTVYLTKIAWCIGIFQESITRRRKG